MGIVIWVCSTSQNETFRIDLYYISRGTLRDNFSRLVTVVKKKKKIGGKI